MNFPFLKAKERLIRIMGTFDLATGHADTFDELLDSLESELRDVLGHYRQQRAERSYWDLINGVDHASVRSTSIKAETEKHSDAEASKGKSATKSRGQDFET